MKKTLALLLALTMLAAVGCSQETEPAAEVAEAEVEITQVDQEAPIATIGEESISFSDYKAMFDTYASYYAMLGYDMSVPETLNDFQDFVVDMLVEEKIVLYQARQAGYTELDAATKAEVEQSVESDMAVMMEALEEQVNLDVEADPSINAEERLAELVADEAEYMSGVRMTYDEFREWNIEYYTSSALVSKFQEDVLSGVSVSDEDVKAWYDSKLQEDKAKYQGTPGDYKIDRENQELYGGTPVAYAPEGYKRVLHILISAEGELPEEYSGKLSEMAALESEYGALAFDKDVLGQDDGGRLKDIAAEYKALEAEAEKIMEDYNSAAVKMAEEAHAKLVAGASFDSVMNEYSQNLIMPEKGWLISNKHVTAEDMLGNGDWSNEIKSAFAKLSVGEFTDVIQDDQGCHILYYLSDEAEGDIPLSEAEESIRDMLLTEAQNNEWIELMELWKNDGSVTLNEELIRSAVYMG